MNGGVLLGVGDLLGLIAVLLFVVIPFVGWVAARIRELVQPPAPPPAQSDSRRIQAQIDEFLRRAGQRRAGQPPPDAEPIVAQVVDDDRVGGRVGKQVQKYIDTSEFGRRSKALGEEVVQADAQMAQQVQQTFSGEAGRLSASMRNDQSADSNDMSAVEVVEVDDPSRSPLDVNPLAGSGLADLLGSPDSISHAIIMNEILRRPEW